MPLQKDNSRQVGALIPVRLASERLPRKALIPIRGKPSIFHLLDRVFLCSYVCPESVVVCTTTDSSDDDLVAAVKEYGANVFRGPVDDLIKRLYDAMKEFSFTHVVQVDGDDITAETDYMNITMNCLLENGSKYDVVSCSGLPLGIASKSISRSGLQKVFSAYQTTDNDTGFGELFTEARICENMVVNPITPNHRCENLRLTLDYEEDLEFFRMLFDALYKEGSVFHLDEILQYVKSNPQAASINSGVQNEYWARWSQKKQIFYSD